MIAALAAGLCACGAAEVRRDAAADVHRFLVAAQDGDRKTFRSYVDKAAVREDLRRQLVAEAKRRGLDTGRPFDDRMIDIMIQPEAFSIQGVSGLGLRGVPGPGRIALMMKVLPDGRACLTQPSMPPACVLTFEKQGERWKLVGLTASHMEIVRKPTS
jgi:hypothetical protein